MIKGKNAFTFTVRYHILDATMANYSTYNDATLLGLLRTGDEAAFGELYNRYSEKLYRSAYRKLATKEQAEEIMQDVLLDIWRRREVVDIAFLPAYLEKAVRFQVLNYVNRNKMPRFLDVFESLLVSPFEADGAFHDEEFNLLLKSWIDTLPKRQRAIFVKHFVEGFCTKEIAEELGLAHKTVQNNISLSVKSIRTRVGHLLIAAAILDFFYTFY